MSRNPILDEYFIKKWSLPFLEILMVLVLVGVLANYWSPGKEEVQVETVVGMVIGSEKFNGNTYLLVELEDGEEILVKLSSFRKVRIGADAKIIKSPADPLTGLKWDYHFRQYLD